jgi:hypothetical protein
MYEGIVTIACAFAVAGQPEAKEPRYIRRIYIRYRFEKKCGDISVGVCVAGLSSPSFSSLLSSYAFSSAGRHALK